MDKKELLRVDLPLLIIYALSYILFLVSLFKGWNIGVIITAIVIFICMLFSIIKPLISKSKIRIMDWIQIIISILGAVILVIAFASASDSKVRDAVIQVSAATIGGLLTLYGVGITIKYNQLERKEDEIKRVRPLFSYNMMRREPDLTGDIMPKMCFSNTLEADKYLCEVMGEIENSSLSTFEIKRIHHDNTWVSVEGNTVILPNSKCVINFRFTDDPRYLFMEVEDILKNKYYYQLKVLFLNTRTSSNKLFHTIREINSISELEMNKAISEEPHFE